MSFGDFLTSSRIGNIFSQPVDRSDMSGFNPAVSTGKRLMTSIVPQPARKPNPTFPTNNPGIRIPESRPQPQMQQQDDGFDSTMQHYFDMLQKADENRPAMGAYQNALNAMPQPEDYKASGWRRALAAGAGAAGGLNAGAAAGVGIADKILRSPYEQQMEQYRTGVEGTRGAAELEAQRISDYKSNLGAAANYAGNVSKMKSDRFFKGRELDINESEADTKSRAEDRQHADTMSQIDRRIAQSKNEAELRRLQGERDKELARHNGATESIGRTNAAAATTSAGASVTSANAAVDRARAAQTTADKTGKGPTPDQQTDAYNLALEQLYHTGRFQGMIKVNQNEYGPSYEVDPSAGAYVEKEVKKKQQDILNKMFGTRSVKTDNSGRILAESYQGDSDDMEEPEESTGFGDFTIGPIQR